MPGYLLILGFETRYLLVALAVFTMIVGSAFHRQFYIAAEKTQLFKDYTLTGAPLFMFVYGAGSLSMDAFLTRAKPTTQNVTVGSPNV